MKQKLSRIGWELLEYLRRMVTPFILNLMFGITMLAVLAIGIPALEGVLMVLLFAGCCAAGLMYMRAAGETAYKMKEIGAARRGEAAGDAEENVTTAHGKYRPSKEYRPYKGVVIALFVCLMPLILIFVGALANNAAARVTMTFACGWAYDPVLWLGRLVGGELGSAAMNSLMWWGLILIAVYIGLCALGYELGANRERRRRAMLEERSERIEEQKQARLERIEEQRQRNRAREEQKKQTGAKTGKK